MDGDRNSGNYAESILRLSGQDLMSWPKGARLSSPCTETVCNLLKHGGTNRIQRANLDYVAHLLHNKTLECAKFRGYYCLAVDATKEESVWARGIGKTGEVRYQLEAKLIAPNGMALSVRSETVRQYSSKKGKQDCEIKAFRRLAARIRRSFPRLPICVVGDALYACGPVMEACRRYGWKFILTFKEGRSPEAYANACFSMACSKDQVGDLIVRGKCERRIKAGLVAWTSGIRFSGQQESDSFHVVACEEMGGGGYRGMFATDFDMTDAGIASEVVAWGRRRWNIENNFKVEKHDGNGLEHMFCGHWRCSRNLYLLMQVANNLWQIYNLCVLPKVSEGCRKMTQVKWVELLRRTFHVIGITRPLEQVKRHYIRRMTL